MVLAIRNALLIEMSSNENPLPEAASKTAILLLGNRRPYSGRMSLRHGVSTLITTDQCDV